MQMALNIFLIHTDHQLHQVCKAIEYFKMAKQSIVILNVNFEKKIVQDYGNTHNYKVINLDNWVFKDLIFNAYKWKKYVSQLKDLKNISKRINFFTSQYLNDTVLLANHILKPSIFYLMDEGTANFTYSDIREKNKKVFLSQMFKFLLYQQYLSLPRSITYFTKYSFKITKKNDSIIRYNEVKIKNNITKINKDKVFYLGTSLVELGLISENDYIDYLRNVLEMYTKKTVYYIPHRKEKALKLKDIERMGYILKKIEIPFEMWYKSLEIIPSEISSHYYSTVLGNLVDLFDNLPKLHAFKSPLLSVAKDADIEQKIFLHLKSKGTIQFTDL